MRTILVTILLFTLLLAGCGGTTGETGGLTVDQVTANLSLPTDTDAVYRLSPGISHLTYQATYARFTPSNSD